MKMILAINNKKVEDALTQIYIGKYELFIVNSKELILDKIIDKSEAIVVLREDLRGTSDIFELLDEIRIKNSRTNIVIIVKKINKKLKEELYSREIFNIIEGKNFKLKELTQAIETPKRIENSKLKDNIKEKIIFILGDNGVGKTVFSKVLAYNIAKSSNKKVLVIDMDFLKPTLDLYVKSNKNYSLVDYIKDVINFNVKEITNYETADSSCQNIKYLLNQKSIGIPNDEITLQIFQMLKGYYDYIIVDTSAYLIDRMYKIALILNANIIYMIEPTVCLLKNLNRKIMVNSIVVVNNYRKDKDILKYIKKDMEFTICEYIHKHNNILNNVLNGKIKINMRKILTEIGIIKYNKFQKLVKKLVLKEELV